MKKTKILFPTAILALSLAFLAGCGANPTAPVPAAAPEAEVSQTDLAPVEAPTVDEGLIAFVTGIVDISDESGWFPAEIGDFITPANSIRTGADSSCEIQFGTTAVIRLEENSEIDISRINLTPEASKVGLEMVAGSVLAKVQKLSKDDSFSVRTQSAVCGVRGTEFSVTTSEGNKTVFAVKEGSVAVLPPDLDIESLKEQVSGKSDSATAAIDQLLESAPRVEADQEMAVDESFAEETREASESVTRAVQEIAAAGNAAQVEEKSRTLVSTAADSTRTIAERTAPAAPISTEKAESLKQTDKMKILDIPVAATRESRAEQPELKLYKIGLKVEPADARITIDGQSVGAGTFSALFEEGREMEIVVERDGFAPYRLPVAVTPDSAKLYTVRLAALQLQQETPAPDPIPEKEAEPQAADEESDLSIEQPVEEPAMAEAAEEDAAAAAAEEAVEPEPVAVLITARPQDARIAIDGGPSGRGSLRTEALPGSKLAVTVERRGFAGTGLTLTVGEAPLSQEIVLDPQPVVFDRKALAEGAVGLAAAGNTLVVSSARGVVTALNRNGGEIWSIETVNSPNENSAPVIIGNRVYFSGAKELVIAGLRSGEVVGRIALDASHSHLFGRRVVPFGEQVLFPSNNAIEFVNPASAQFRPYVSIEGAGSRMTPGVADGRTMIATQEGLFAVFGSDGNLVGEVWTKAVQPVALAVSVFRDSAVFAGRRGDVAAINLRDISVRWERALSDDSVSVASDLAVGPEGIYAFGRGGAIYGLAWQDGGELFTPIRGASTPPGYNAGSLVYGTRDGKLIIASAADGATRKSFTLGEQATTRPVFIDGMIAVGTKSGRVVLIEPEGIR